MNNKGYTTIEIFGVIAVFSAIYLFGMVNVSYAFSSDYELEYYEKTLNLIENQSLVYANLNEDLFEESDVIYLYVEDLIEMNLLTVDEDGNLANPTSKNETLNKMKIKVVLVDGEYVASIVEI